MTKSEVVNSSFRQRGRSKCTGRGRAPGTVGKVWSSLGGLGGACLPFPSQFLPLLYFNRLSTLLSPSSGQPTLPPPHPSHSNPVSLGASSPPKPSSTEWRKSPPPPTRGSAACSWFPLPLGPEMLRKQENLNSCELNLGNPSSYLFMR